MRHLGAGLSKLTIALIFLSAIVFVSCKESIHTVDAIEQTDSIATQVVYNMHGSQTEFGKIRMRFEAPLMENYGLLKEPFETFPQGIKVITYTPEGAEEMRVRANSAIHKKGRSERWEVYGNVVINNMQDGSTVETDTLYWDQSTERIYTHAYIKHYSPKFLTQGFGMEADDRAKDVTIFKPFDNYGILERDTLSKPPTGEELLQVPADTTFRASVDSLLRPAKDSLNKK